MGRGQNEEAMRVEERQNSLATCDMTPYGPLPTNLLVKVEVDPSTLQRLTLR